MEFIRTNGYADESIWVALGVWLLAVVAQPPMESLYTQLVTACVRRLEFAAMFSACRGTATKGGLQVLIRDILGIVDHRSRLNAELFGYNLAGPIQNTDRLVVVLLDPY